MGLFEKLYGSGVIIGESKKSKPKQSFPTCKFCNGELIAIRTPNRVISCRECGKTQ